MGKDNENIIPGAPEKYANPYISETTLKNLTPANIDTLGALGRMMNIQDGYIKALLQEHHKAFDDRLELFEKKVFDKIDTLEKKIDEQVCVFDKFQKDEFMPLKETVEEMKADLYSVKKKNTWLIIILRGLGWTTVGMLIIRLLHGPFIH
jgi:hypothetical protein